METARDHVGVEDTREYVRNEDVTHARSEDVTCQVKVVRSQGRCQVKVDVRTETREQVRLPKTLTHWASSNTHLRTHANTHMDGRT